MSCGPRSLGRAQTGVNILTGTTKLRFSCIHRSMKFYLKITKFAVELPAYKGRLDSKIEVNCARRSEIRKTKILVFVLRFFLFSFFFSSFFVFSHKSEIQLGAPSKGPYCLLAILVQMIEIL